jgi:hypothetical protein
LTGGSDDEFKDDFQRQYMNYPVLSFSHPAPGRSQKPEKFVAWAQL